LCVVLILFTIVYLNHYSEFPLFCTMLLSFGDFHSPWLAIQHQLSDGDALALPVVGSPTAAAIGAGSLSPWPENMQRRAP